MKQILITITTTVMLCGCKASEEPMRDVAGRVFALAKTQYAMLDASLPEGRYPRTFEGDSLVTSDMGWWCSGFYPGCLWDVFEATGDQWFFEAAQRRTKPLAGLLERHTDHDIGFQLMASFGKQLRFAGYGRDVLEKGSRKLEERFVPEAGVIRSWDFGHWEVPVIIDNMMNLRLLTYHGDPEIARRHALTTAENHFRPDGTCWHLVDYGTDGSVIGKQTVQGFADSTAWARGQAWALLGFTRMAADSEDKVFLRTATRIEGWLLEHLPEDGIPFWDFSQTDFKDSSAATIIALGLLELADLRADGPRSPARKTARRILRTLASPEYLAEPGTNGGFLLRHGVGHKPNNSEVDVPLSYADYYFLEALIRCR